MFSIFHGLFTLFAIGVNNINKNIQDEENRTEAKKSGLLTYSGSRGGTYLVENGRQVCHSWIGDHEVLRDMWNGKAYVDLTAEKEKKYKERVIKSALEDGRETYLCSEQQKGIIKWYPTERFSVDIETEAIVSTLIINKRIFYMDMRYGNLIRETLQSKNNKRIRGDEDFYKYIKIPLNANKIIEVFNKRQAFLSKHPLYNNDSTWMRETYFLRPNGTMSYKYFMDYNGKILVANEDINPGFPELISAQDYIDRESEICKEIEKIKEKRKEEIKQRREFYERKK